MRHLVIGALLLLVGLGVNAQEKITLSAPVFVSAGATDFRVLSLSLKRSAGPNDDASIGAIFREVTGSPATFVPNGRTLTCTYSGATAESLIIALNTANLSTQSLEHRIIARCQADGQLGAGSISGTAGH